MAINDDPSIVSDATEQNKEELPDNQDIQALDVVEEPSEPAPENMAAADQILSPQAPLSEILTSLKDYPADGSRPAPIESQSESFAQEQPQGSSIEPQATDKPMTQGEAVSQAGAATEEIQPTDEKDYSTIAFLKELYSNGNECITLASGAFPASDQTRELLALFSNGRFFVVEDSKYDGRVQTRTT